MKDIKNIEARLKRPFLPSEIKWRIGSTSKNGDKATALAYVDARAVMDRLDEVFGVDGWKTEVAPQGEQGFVCTLSCFFPDEVTGGRWVSKADGADQSDVEGFKGGISDALKRAAVGFGVGRYLYQLGTTWVDLYERGQLQSTNGYQYSPVKGVPKYFQVPQLPGWAIPEETEEQAMQAMPPVRGLKPAPQATSAPSGGYNQGGGYQSNGGYSAPKVHADGYGSDQFWAKFPFYYELPKTFDGMNFEESKEVRETLKGMGVKCRGPKYGGNWEWYSPNRLEVAGLDFDVFCTPNPSYNGPAVQAAPNGRANEVMHGDDIAF